jgi:probable poly-beta-1,6-N-acetyl-D-glucosamine export protein
VPIGTILCGQVRQEPESFLINVHLFRGVAIVAVVATHVLFELDWQSGNQTEFRVCVSLLQNGTVWFVFIAGLLFRHLAQRFDYVTYLRSKLRFVLLPYFIVSLPYLVLQYVRSFGFFSPHKPENRSLWAIVASFGTGEQMRVPLWFVPMICVFYLLAPVLLWLDGRKWGYWLLPLLFLMASLVHRPFHQTHLLQTVPYFLPVYFGGMWVGKNLVEVMSWVQRWRWGCLLLALLSCVYEVVTRERPGAIESLAPFSTERGVFDVNIYAKVLLALVVLECLQRCPRVLSRVFDYLARLSFGIFFVHYYFIYWGKYYRDTTGAVLAGSALHVALATLVVTVLTAITVAVLRQALGRRSRYVVGC